MPAPRSLNIPLSSNKRKTIKYSSLIFAALGIPLLGFLLLIISALYFVGSHNNDSQNDSTGAPAAANTIISNAVASAERIILNKDSNANNNSNNKDVKYHIIFSTGCSTFQDWQSYLFFHGAMVAQQPGTITRIVSGCKPEDEETLRKIFAEQIEPMSADGRFKIHFTPDFSTVKPEEKYKYFNKPYGTRHWLEHVLGFPDHPIDEDSIVALLDPDQMIIRPFTNNDFSNTEWIYLKPGREPYTKIEHGKPMGQLYGFDLQFKKKIVMSHVTSEHSPVDDMSDDEARAGYVVGPPYIATARDMYQIAVKWTEFAVPIHDQYPYLLAEMFAYCLAAAHLKLAHQTASSFMVSEVSINRGEGWGKYVDQLSESEVCEKNDPARYPNVIHFCQRYGLGPYFFGKYRFPHDFLTCESPLLAEPPKSIASQFQEATYPGGEIKIFSKTVAKRNAFQLCQLIPALNAASTYYKANHCDPPSSANMEKSIMFT